MGKTIECIKAMKVLYTSRRNSSSHRSMMLLALLIPLILACSGPASLLATATPTATSTPEPTATPTPTSTPAPTATPDVAILNQKQLEEIANDCAAGTADQELTDAYNAQEETVDGEVARYGVGFRDIADESPAICYLIVFESVEAAKLHFSGIPTNIEIAEDSIARFPADDLSLSLFEDLVMFSFRRRNVMGFVLILTETDKDEAMLTAVKSAQTAAKDMHETLAEYVP